MEPYRRRACSAGDADAAFADGTLYLAGGLEAGTPIGPVPDSSAVYAYTPGANRWSKVANLPHPLASAAAAVLNGQLYIIGGCATTGGCPYPTWNTVYQYDPAANKWTRLANYPSGPVTNEACGGIDGQIACAGGLTDGAVAGVGTTGTYLYDPVTNTWSRGADMPEYADSMVYGAANGELQVTGSNENLSATYQYNPATNAWNALPSAPNLNGYPIGSASGSCGFYRVGGVLHKAAPPFTVVSTVEMLPGYTQCDGAAGLGWLSESQSSLTVAPGQSVAVDVEMDGFVKVSWPHRAPLIWPRRGGGDSESSPLIWPRRGWWPGGGVRSCRDRVG